MEYRHWNKQNTDISLLGFGCMRFPLNEDGSIDREESARLLETARAAGVNYFDTAHPYHHGESQAFLGEFLQRWERDSYKLATKLPFWDLTSLDEAKEIFAKQLELLQTDYIDFYLLHAMSVKNYQKALDFGIIEWCQTLKAEGKIKNLGFSFHDEYELFETILTSHDWDFCQIQYNYMDKNHQAGEKGVALAEKLGIPLVIMEPVRGGSLTEFPEALTAPLQQLRPGKSTASWGFRWLGSQKPIYVILSGMSTMEQVLDNTATFTNFTPLTEAEQQAILNLETELRKRTYNTCTGCAYCQPCPKGVKIPACFAAWNNYGIYGATVQTENQWNGIEASARPEQCVGCGACEKVCPQQIDIRGDLAKLCVELDKAHAK